MAKQKKQENTKKIAFFFTAGQIGFWFVTFCYFATLKEKTQ